MENNMFDFQVEVIEQSHTLPVLVDFWAEWCAPCRMLGPVLEKLAAKYTGSWRLVKINTGEFPELAERYQVRGIPDVKLFVAGEAVDGFSGALSEYQIEQWLKKVEVALVDEGHPDRRSSQSPGRREPAEPSADDHHMVPCAAHRLSPFPDRLARVAFAIGIAVDLLNLMNRQKDRFMMKLSKASHESASPRWMKA